MKHLQMALLLLLSILVGNVCAGEVREFALQDGSLITAEIVSLKEGVYTLQSSSLGIIHIDASEVRAIRLHPSGAAAREQDKPVQGSVVEQIQSLQQSMMSNTEVMHMMSSLLQDPEFQEALSDPAIVEAVRAHDLNALLSHPKFIRLLDHPLVRDISRETMP